VDAVRFVGRSGGSATVVCASKNSWDHTLRLLSLSDNQYLRYFKGHRDRYDSCIHSAQRGSDLIDRFYFPSRAQRCFHRRMSQR
jgi:hypothetical protein